MAALEDDAIEMYAMLFSFSGRAFVATFCGVLFFGSLFVSCKKPPSPSPEIQARYRVHAEIFCKAITTCIQEVVRERLKDEPQRRDMVLARMNRELCRKNQFRLLTSLEADPRGPQQRSAAPTLYESYGHCAEKLKGAPNCKEVRKIYDMDVDCQRVRFSRY